MPKCFRCNKFTGSEKLVCPNCAVIFQNLSKSTVKTTLRKNNKLKK